MRLPLGERDAALGTPRRHRRLSYQSAVAASSRSGAELVEQERPAAVERARDPVEVLLQARAHVVEAGAATTASKRASSSSSSSLIRRKIGPSGAAGSIAVTS